MFIDFIADGDRIGDPVDRLVRDDIVQEINILLWEKRGSFELGTNFKAWAFAVVR